MPLDFTKPVVTGNYATDILPPIVQAHAALAQMLDPAVAGTLTGTPTGAFRFNSNAVERYNGTTWGAYAINGINWDGTKVSIGTASPISKLTVSDPTSAASAPAITIQGSLASGGNGHAISWYQNSTTVAASYIASNADAAGGKSELHFGTTSNFGVSAATTKMVLDGVGNLGFGVTPGVWEASAKAVEFAYPTFGMAGSTGAAFMSFNARNSTGTTWVYKSADEAGRFEAGTDGGFKWYTAPTGAVGAAISWNNTMSLDAAGKLGLGVVPAASIHTAGQQIRIQHSAGILEFFKDATPTKAARVAFNGSAGADSVSLGVYNGSTWNDALVVSAAGAVLRSASPAISSNDTEVATTAFVRSIAPAFNGISSFSADASLASSDAGKIIVFAGTSGATIVLTLPAANSVPAGMPFHFVVRSTFIFISAVAAAGTDTILDGGATLTSVLMWDAGDSFSLVSNGAGSWQYIGPRRRAVSAYISGLPAANASSSFAHSLGVTPSRAWMIAECTTADLSYSVGNRTSPLNANGTSFYEPAIVRTESSIILMAGSGGWAAANAATGGNPVAMTNARWKYRLYCEV